MSPETKFHLTTETNLEYAYTNYAELEQ